MRAFSFWRFIMAGNSVSVGGYALVSATGNIAAGPRSLLGIFVSSASGSPSITVYDESATGTTTKVIDTFTPVAATWYPLPFNFKNGINIVIGGTVSASACYL
jgi:hypothetical protein